MVSSFFDADHDAAEREFQRALMLNPNYAVAHQWYGAHLCFMADFQHGLAELQEAQRLEPLSPMINVQLGVGFYLARQYEEAARVLLHTLEFEPAFWPAHYFLGKVFAQQGDSRAMAALEVAAKLSGRHPLTLSGLGRVLAAKAGRSRPQRSSMNCAVEPAVSMLVLPISLRSIWNSAIRTWLWNSCKTLSRSMPRMQCG